MILKPKLNHDGSLTLEALSYDGRELDDLKLVLAKSGIRAESERLEESEAYRQDRRLRFGYRYTIDKEDIIKLEQFLDVRFVNVTQKLGILGDRTVARVVDTGGQRYRCRQITIKGEGRGCVNMSANSNTEATVKCAFIANNYHWFGGVALHGTCPPFARVSTKIGEYVRKLLLLE